MSDKTSCDEVVLDVSVVTFSWCPKWQRKSFTAGVINQNLVYKVLRCFMEQKGRKWNEGRSAGSQTVCWRPAASALAGMWCKYSSWRAFLHNVLLSTQQPFPDQTKGLLVKCEEWLYILFGYVFINYPRRRTFLTINLSFCLEGMTIKEQSLSHYLRRRRTTELSMRVNRSINFWLFTE